MIATLNRSAQRHRAAGRTDAALRCLLLTAEMDAVGEPDRREAVTRIGVLYRERIETEMKAGRVRAAIRLCVRLAGISPSPEGAADVEKARIIARLSEQAGAALGADKPAQALRLCRWMFQVDPRPYELCRGAGRLFDELARHYEARGRAPQARELRTAYGRYKLTPVGAEGPAVRRHERVDHLQLVLRSAEVHLQRSEAGSARRLWREALGKLKRPRSSAERLERFKILVGLKRYPEAFREGERILEAGLNPEAFAVLICPWGNVAPYFRDAAVIFKQDIAVLRRIVSGRPASPWAHYYLGTILSRCEAEGRSGRWYFEEAARYSPKRYGWIWLELCRRRLVDSDFPGTLQAAKVAFEGVPAPENWRAHAYAGEANLCLGRRRQAWRSFGSAFRAAGRSPGDALAWEGEARLWAGDYSGALRVLDRAVALDAPYAFCWRGAAKYKLGRHAEALQDLESGLRVYPRDLEALAWRGEIYRVLGEHEAALRDLNLEPLNAYLGDAPSWRDRINQGRDGRWTWNLINRALVRWALKDAGGLREDFSRIEPQILDQVRRGGGNSAAAMAAALKRVLGAARGCRRPDSYVNRSWMRR